MGDFIKDLSGGLIDLIVYSAMALLFILGVFKCVLPARASAHALRRGQRSVEKPVAEGTRPAWQDARFLGDRLSGPWSRFLKNAEQLNSRGLSCNAEDYINESTALDAVCHPQFAEIIPGLLTSLGILGTFIGLMRGLGGLDVSDAAKTMDSIPGMIGGMTFAFSTSIVGVACSITFNILYRMACGKAQSAAEDFSNAFNARVMLRPLEDNVTLICQQEDQENLLRQSASDLSARVAEGVSKAVENSFLPVSDAMRQFILGQSQAQVEGVQLICDQFIRQMDRSLGGQLSNLGAALSQVHQQQNESFEALNAAMAACDSIMKQMNRIQAATNEMISRFDGFVARVEEAQSHNDAFLVHGNEVLSGMISASADEGAVLSQMRNQLDGLHASMQDFASFTGQASDAMRRQADSILQLSDTVSGQMESSARHFADAFGSELRSSANQLDQHITSSLRTLNEKLQLLRSEHGIGDDDSLSRELAATRKALQSLQISITALKAAEKKEEA